MSDKQPAPDGRAPSWERAGTSSQFVTFMLAAEEYGIDILRVQEIRGWEAVTPIPKAPEFVRGVMNLRGEVVPVLDLRRRFDLEPREHGPTTVVVVVKMETGETVRTIGLVVDAISEVYDIPSDHCSPTPDVGCAVDAAFVKGIAMVEKKMIILLDVDRLASGSMLDTEREHAA